MCGDGWFILCTLITDAPPGAASPSPESNHAVPNQRQLLAALLARDPLEAVFLYRVTCKEVWIETDCQGSNALRHDVAKILNCHEKLLAQQRKKRSAGNGEAS